jgi:hypothetical protein
MRLSCVVLALVLLQCLALLCWMQHPCFPHEEIVFEHPQEA